MMQGEEPVYSWEAFLGKINDLSSFANDKFYRPGNFYSKWLYRGQRSCRWHLETTLERNFQESELDVSKYFRWVYSEKPRIETFTKTNWKLPRAQNLIENLEKNASSKNIYGLSPPLNTALFEYLVFLRHHGFPSPLLDWTASPYIAAFFAFHNAGEENGAIWAFQEFSGHGKAAGGKEPWITTVGPSIKSHERHFLQKSDYTVCFKNINNSYKFWSHEDLRKTQQPKNLQQDKIIKFVLDIGERKKVLKILDSVNINSFSLFQTTESLMQAIAAERTIYNS